MPEPTEEPLPPGAPRPPPYRDYALMLFWLGLLVAGLSPPGPMARVATVVATVGGVWFVLMWLNRRWRQATRDKL